MKSEKKRENTMKEGKKMKKKIGCQIYVIFDWG